MNARLRVQILRADIAARDAAVDALLRFENHERAVAQSAATLAGRRAELPEREGPSLRGVADAFNRMFARPVQ